MEAEQVEPRRGNQHAKFLDELQGIQEQMGGAISARMGQLVGELSIGALGESVQGQRGPQEVATEVLELLSGSRVEGHIGVQRESLQTRATKFFTVHHRGGGAKPAHGVTGARTGGDELLNGGGGVRGLAYRIIAATPATIGAA
jgi:hypothetical protein